MLVVIPSDLSVAEMLVTCLTAPPMRVGIALALFRHESFLISL